MTKLDELQTCALALVRAGYSVFPLGEDRRPLPGSRGFHDSTTNHESVVLWFLDHGEQIAHIGIDNGRSAVVVLDLDEKHGKSGTASLHARGYTVPPTLTFSTPSGGTHHVFRDPNGEDERLERWQDYDGLSGVDRCSGLGYSVWYGTAADASAPLAPAPDWLTIRKPRKTDTAEGYDEGVDSWLARCAPGEPSMLFETWLSEMRDRAGSIDHTAMITGQAFLVARAAEGEPGVVETLAAFRDLYLDHPEGHFAEWAAGLEGAVGKFGGFVLEARRDAPEVADIDDLTQHALVQELRRRTVKRLADQAEAATAPTIALVTVEQLLKRSRPEWLVEDFIPRNTLNLLAGAPGLGKSFVAIDLGCSVAVGLPFLGLAPTVRGRVLYVAGEGVGGIPDRIRSWMQWRGTGVPEGFVMAESGVSLSDEGSVQRLEALIQQHDIDLVIFDTFRKLSSVSDENQPGEVGLALRNAERVCKAREGCSALVVHHTNKGNEINGTRAFESEPENVYVLRGTDAGFDIRAVKTKDAAGLGFTGLRLHSVGESAVVCPIGAEPTRDHIAMLAPGSDVTTAQLHDILHDIGSQSTRERAISNYVSSGRLIRVSKGEYKVPIPSRPNEGTESVKDAA